MDLHLQNKTVVVTGGGTGIGREAALAFLREGCHVAICGRRQERLDEAAALAAKEGFELMTESVDIRNEEALAAFADRVEEKYGRIDVWINNAGANKSKALMDYTREEFAGMTDLLLVSVFSGCKIAAQHMRKDGKGGVIMNASSFSAIIPNAGRAPYSACKAGVSSLTRTFAAELAKDNIRVLAYVPGLIDTEIVQDNIAKNRDALLASIPVRRFGKPEDLAKVIVFLSSDCAEYVNGVNVTINGAKFAVQNPQYSWQ